MKPLPAQWTRRGYVSRVIKRTGDVVMVQLGKADCYEVAIVQRHNGWTTPRGKVVEPAEHMPNDEEFGRLGWYYPAREPAFAKFRDLVAAQSAKEGLNSSRPIPGYTPEAQNPEFQRPMTGAEASP